MKTPDFVCVQIPNLSGEDIFWLEYNAVRRDLFGFLKREVSNLPWQSGPENIVPLLPGIGQKLIENWICIKEHYSYDQEKQRRLSGAYYEALFYFASLTKMILYTETWQLKFTGRGQNFPPEDPPYLAVVPIFEVIPRMFWFRESRGEKRYAPQMRGDFVAFHLHTDGTLWTSIIDVKRTEPQNKLMWEVAACGLVGTVFELAFPKKGVQNPLHPDDWEIKPVCLNCGRWNIINGVCKNCGTDWVSMKTDG